MDNYQHKRVIGNLKRRGSLNDVQIRFLESIKDKKVISWPAKDPDPLTEKQAHVLNQIASKVGG